MIGPPATVDARPRFAGRTLAPSLAPWWPLLALLALAAALRLSTLTLQSLWYDEAYTPVHVLHVSLGATLHAWLHDENTPPAWYLVAWAVTRAFGTGALALRMPSALFGVALVGVCWAIGAEIGSRRVATTLAALAAVNPLFVWYSQEARAYELYALTAAISLLWFLRARRRRTAAALGWWSASSIVALLTHYFAVFLVAPEALLLLAAMRPTRARTPAPRAATLLAVGALAGAGAALVPLVIAQGGHGTQWIGRWALGSRLLQIPGYYLLGANGAALGHGVLLLSALPALAAIGLVVVLAARRRLAPSERDAIAVTAGIGLVALAVPLVLALAGADYLAPRNTIADFVPLSAALAVALGAPAAGRAGPLVAAAACASGLALVIAADTDARLQRGDWGAVAAALRPATADRAIVTVEVGAAPLEYYLPALRLRYLSSRRVVRVREIDLVGFVPLRADASRPPTPSFAPAGRSDHDGLLVFRFVAERPQAVSGRLLRSLTLTVGARSTSEALVPAAVPSHARR